MPTLSQFSGQSIPSSAGALARRKREELESQVSHHDKRDCNPIDNALGVTLAIGAIAAIMWAVIQFYRKNDESIIHEYEDDEEVTEERLEEDAMASIAGGVKRRNKRGLKRHETDLEILDWEEFMKSLRDRMD